ncbi:MAG: DUF3795 domain-containing protein [Oscillospiraceae bacterium]|nr:DUF3795 domain-containing protein [Oscillospiraceae bacterium]
MKRVPDERCVSICGLFCGACPAYPEECHGCLSDHLRASCRECKHGFRDCVKEHQVSRCYECSSFPCERLEVFSKGPIINGVNNHANVIPDSCRLQEVGIEQWLKEKMEQHICPKCGELISWYNMQSHSCRDQKGK